MKNQRIFFITFILLTSVLFFFCCTGPGFCRLSSQEEEPPVQARLLVFDSDFSSAIKAGIYFNIRPGWHLYWINPGDSGMPPEITWNLPEGFKAGEVIFPVPQKFTKSGQVTYGFTEELLLLCEIETPEGFNPKAEEPFPINAMINWMVCRESCALGRSEISLILSEISPDDIETAKAIKQNYPQAYPQSADALDVIIHDIKRQTAGRNLIVEISLKGKDVSQIENFYPYPVDDFVLKQDKTGFEDGKIHLELTLSGKTSALSKIKGLLITGRSGYEISIPMSENSQ